MAGLDADVSSAITLVSGDGISFEVDRKCAGISKSVSTAMEDLTATKVQLPAVKGDILALVVEFMNHHQVAVACKCVRADLRRARMPRSPRSLSSRASSPRSSLTLGT